MCEACQQGIVACEELHFEDHYRKWDADSFSNCLIGRLTPAFQFKLPLQSPLVPVESERSGGMAGLCLAWSPPS